MSLTAMAPKRESGRHIPAATAQGLYVPCFCLVRMAFRCPFLKCQQVPNYPSDSRKRKVATCPRVQLRLGIKWVASIPRVIPLAAAHNTAS